MKNLWKYVLIGLCTVIAEWVFVALVAAFFTGLSQNESVAIGTGFFLAFEMIICTGAIVEAIKKNR